MGLISLLPLIVKAGKVAYKSFDDKTTEYAKDDEKRGVTDKLLAMRPANLLIIILTAIGIVAYGGIELLNQVVTMLINWG